MATSAGLQGWVNPGKRGSHKPATNRMPRPCRQPVVAGVGSGEGAARALPPYPRFKHDGMFPGFTATFPPGCPESVGNVRCRQPRFQSTEASEWTNPAKGLSVKQGSPGSRSPYATSARHAGSALAAAVAASPYCAAVSTPGIAVTTAMMSGSSRFSRLAMLARSRSSADPVSA